MATRQGGLFLASRTCRPLRDPAAPPPGGQMIRLQNVSKTYFPTSKRRNARGIEALKAVDLHVPQGQIHGVIGLSGAGKST